MNLIPLNLDRDTGNFVAAAASGTYVAPTGTGFQYVTGGIPNTAAITLTQATSMLNLFTSSLQGLVPASGGGTANFLRADGTWASPVTSAGVVSFNTRTGAVTLASGDVTTALGFIPYSSANPAGYLAVAVTSAVAGTGISVSSSTGAVTIANTGVTSVNTRTGAVVLNSTDVTSAIGFTPYNATNPSGFITASQAVTLTGDVAGSGPLSSSIATTLATVATSGTYKSVTIDVKGRVLSGTNPTTLAGFGITDGLSTSGGTMSGSITMTGGSTVTGIPTPVAATDAANKSYVDAAIQGLSWKEAVSLASTVNIPVLSGTLTVDGVASVVGQRVLVKNQTDTTTNGIYVVALGAWARSSDAATGPELTGAAVLVEQGTQADTQWVQASLVTNVGTDSINFVQLGNGSGTVTSVGITSADMAVTGSPITTSGNFGLTLNSVNTNVGSFTNANITVNAKGLITAASSGSSSSPLTATQVGFGSSSNVLTGSSNLTWQDESVNINNANVLTAGNFEWYDQKLPLVTYGSNTMALGYSDNANSPNATITLPQNLLTSSASSGPFNGLLISSGSQLLGPSMGLGMNLTLQASNTVSSTAPAGSVYIQAGNSSTGATLNGSIYLQAAPVGGIGGVGPFGAPGSTIFTSGNNIVLTVNSSGAIGTGNTPSYGTTGQVLTSAGSNAVPTWTTISSGGTGTVTSVGISGTDFSITGSPVTTSGIIALTLATVNSNVGTFNNVTVNAKGLVTAASNVGYLTANQTTTLSGDVTGSGTTAITATLATVNSNVGTFNNVTVNAKGLVTAASTVAYLTANQNITVSGDVTGSGTTALALTLATVNGNVGTFTNATVTVDGKGRVTSVSSGTASGTGTVTSVAVSGSDFTISGSPITTSGTIALSLATVNGNVGTFGTTTAVPQIAVNAKGLITAVTNVAVAFPVTSVFGRTGAVVAATNDYSFAQLSGSATAAQLPALSATGDATGTGTAGTGSIPLTLATVNGNVGTFTNATISVDGKGRITAASSGSGGGGSGTVTNVSVTAGTGITASVTNATTTPNITIAATSALGTGGNGVERVVYQYSTGSVTVLNSTTPVSITSGVSVVSATATTCTITFSFTGYDHPPVSVMGYGQNANSNTWAVRNLASSTITTVSDSGTQSSPSLITGFAGTNNVTVVATGTNTGSVALSGTNAYFILEFKF